MTKKRQKKMDHSIAIYSIFCIGMVYFRCLQVNPHIQALQNMCSKVGWAIVYGKKWFKFASSILKILVDDFFWTPQIRFSFFWKASKIYHTYTKNWVNRDWVNRFFLAIFGHFWAREPNLHCKISDFGFLSVSFDFFVWNHIVSHRYW